MSLLEVVVSSVVLAGSSSAALGVWNQAASEIQRAKQLDALSLQLETARIATHRWLQSDAAASGVIDPSSAGCRFNPEV
jgi:outer membrane murein-binding lipoprotein Lpp